MARFVFHFSPPSKLLILAACLAAALCFQAPPAFAQHAGVGGHFGAGGHAGAAHVAAPHAAAPHVAVPSPGRAAVPPFRFSGGSRPLGIGAPGFRFRPRPIHPHPVLPIIPFPIFFGGPFFGYWPGYGFNSLWWPSCYPYWGWGFGCNAAPYAPYYGFGGYISPYVSPSYAQPEYTPSASYYGGEESRQRPRLYLKDGTIYSVTDYWLINGQIHFTTIEEGGTKSVEHVIPFEDLDLQQTIDVNTRMGFRFVLRNAPIEQYLQNRNEDNPPPQIAPPQEN